MSNNKWKIYYYTTTDGTSPIKDFIDELSPEDRARVRKGMKLLEEFGPQIGMPHVKPVRDKLWELRVRGRTHHRIIWFIMSGRNIVFLHTFTKKTDKIAQRHIDTALRRRKEIEKRYGGD